MNYTLQRDLRLLARNEGKIKSYESCSDVRAWSHDVSAKDRHLREWMKCDMPICMIPASTLTSFLRTMTCKSRRRVAPRCHPDCKSKALLESICTSCHAMRECLKQDDNFDKYFVEEELETSQWPCERCLDALKSIKMFWKIIIDKIFNINHNSCNEFQTDCNSGDSVCSVAMAWQNGMVEQAMYVRNISPNVAREPLLGSSSSTRETKRETSQRTIKSCPVEEKCYSKHISRTRHANYLIRPHDCTLDDNRNHSRRICKKVSRSIHAGVKMVDALCNTCFMEKENEEIMAHKKNLLVLQDKCNVHIEEVERLKRENKSLRIELENVYNSCPWKASFCCSDYDSNAPIPFETSLGHNCPNSVKNIDSEMIITMKKCKHENFKHVSLLQVLHKTNEPRTENTTNGSCYQKEDPIEILTKVQNTFGAMVEREIIIANERRHHKMKKSDIEATFHRVNTSKSAPSCSTLSAKLSSELNFVSAKETGDRHNVR